MKSKGYFADVSHKLGGSDNTRERYSQLETLDQEASPWRTAARRRFGPAAARRRFVRHFYLRKSRTLKIGPVPRLKCG